MARALAALLLAGVLVASAGAATPKRGGTIVAVRPPLSCLNPFRACNLGSIDLSQVLEGAFEVAPDLVFRPNLVSRVTIGRNPFTLTYHIRPDARWNDGVPVSASDFRFTYRTLVTHDLGRAKYAWIRRVQVLDAKTFRVELREPYADWRFFFDFVLPSHALAGEDVTAAALWQYRVDNPKTGRPIGNGPFLVGRLDPGRQLILVRNRHYWGRQPAYVERLIFRFGGFDPADPLGPMRRHEVTLATGTPPTFGALSAAHAAEVRRIPGWRVVAWPTLGKEQLTFRIGPGGHPALRSKLIRRALAYGIDRVGIAGRVNSELGRRAQPLDSTVFFPGQPFYRSSWDVYRYDPARSRRLLEQAGCRRGGDGIYSCAGERLRLRILTTAGIPHREQALRLIAEQLRLVGVDVEPRYVPGPALFGTVLPGGDFDAALVAWFAGPTGTLVPDARCGNVQNWSGYCSRLTMRDAQQVDRIVDPRLRAAALNAADLKLANDVPVLPLFQSIRRAAVRTSVRGFVAGDNFWEDSENWWLAR